MSIVCIASGEHSESRIVSEHIEADRIVASEEPWFFLFISGRSFFGCSCLLFEPRFLL